MSLMTAGQPLMSSYSTHFSLQTEAQFNSKKFLHPIKTILMLLISKTLLQQTKMYFAFICTQNVCTFNCDWPDSINIQTYNGKWIYYVNFKLARMLFLCTNNNNNNVLILSDKYRRFRSKCAILYYYILNNIQKYLKDRYVLSYLLSFCFPTSIIIWLKNYLHCFLF